MINKKINIRLLPGVLACIALLIMVALLANRDRLTEDTWTKFKPALKEGWVIVNGAIEGQKAYTIVSTGDNKDYGDLFVVFHRNSDLQWEQEYENDFKDLKPWKLELGDVNGDGSSEILIAVRKTTHFDTEEKNRMFVFRYDGEKLIKTWTGSGTEKTWSDFLVGNLLPIKGEELIFIEQAENGKERLSVYYWFDFGFVLLGQSGSFKNILNISILEENRIRMTYDEVWQKKAILTVKSGKLIEE